MKYSIYTCIKIGYAILIAQFFTCFSCSMKEDKLLEEKIMARIGNKEITVEEYIYRIELTIHPQYPALNDEDMKNVLLNNLIAEKLMAIEIGEENLLAQNEMFQSFIRGIKEQAMRERLYYKQVFNKVTLDSQEIKKIYPLAGREYKVAYYSIHNDRMAMKIKKQLQTNEQLFEKIYCELSEKNKVPEKTVSFKDSDSDIVHDALFSELLEPDRIVGPLKIEKNNYLVMKVLDWKFSPTIGGEDIQKRWCEVSEKLKQKKAAKMWKAYVGKIMHGKGVEFMNETFFKLADLFFDLYITSESEKRQKLLKNFLNNEEMIFDQKTAQQNLLEQPLFSIDNQVWTVRDFRKVWISHPLVYREKPADKPSFYKQFRLAIIDMITDYYITKEAYRKSLDKELEVKRKITMWRDAYLALFHRDQYLKSVVKKDDFDQKYMRGKDNYLSFYVDSLQKKYSDKIEINFDALKNIQLTRIQLYAFRPGVPYPAAVPAFSEYIMDGELDYGQKMEMKR